MATLDHLGREFNFKLDVPADHKWHGRSFKAARLERQQWDDWLAWAAKRLPDPVDVVLDKAERLSKYLPPENMESLICKTLETQIQHMSITSPRVQALFESPEGGSYMLWLVLRPNHGDLTEADAIEIYFALTDAKLQEMLTVIDGARQAAGKETGLAASV